MDHITSHHERNANIELLRIIAMLWIIADHFSLHGGFNFQTDSITLNNLWYQFKLMGGGIGNSIFIITSGYFLINSPKINLNRLKILWLEIFFYSVSIYTILLSFGYVKFKIIDLVKILMPVTFRQWWFVTCYFTIYLIHPFINSFFKSISKNLYRTILIIFLILPIIMRVDRGLREIIWFIYLYIVGGYIRLYADNFGNKKYILLALFGIIINFVLTVIFDMLNFHRPLLFGYATLLYGRIIYITFFISVCLFIFFKHLKIDIPLINLISSCTLGVYLIHENKILRPVIWQNIFKNASYQDSPYLIIYSVFVIVCVYISCVIIELLRQKIKKIIAR